jgi:MFS family permease
MTEAVEAEANWGRRLLLGGGIAVLAVVAVLVASAAVPRWWAHRIGDRVDGSITQGVLVGLFFGFVFTFLALVVFIFVMRRGRTVRSIAIGLAAVLVFASPNLMTLGIVLGVGSGAHAGDRTLDVEAPAFRGATLVGAIVAGLLASYLWYLLASRDSAREAHRRAKNRLEAATSPAEESETTPPSAA